MKSMYFLLMVLMIVPTVGFSELQSVAEPVSQPVSTKLSDPLKEEAMTETTLQDQADVAVTIYNNNLALVRDKRHVKLLPGEASLRFADVATEIKPETVSLRSVSAPGSLHILEQNYEFDLMSPAKLMEKYVGKKVFLYNFSTEVNFQRQEAELLSVNDGPVYKVDNSIFLGYPGQVVLPEIPANLIAKPSLIWLLQNEGTDHDVEVTYLTEGIQWKADYVVTLAADEAHFDVEGWVTLNNQSGTQYTNATLKVVAGEVNIVQEAQRPMPAPMMAAKAGGMVADRVMMQEEPFAEYHLYALPRKTTIRQNESKQVSLLAATDACVHKVYEYRGNESFFSQPMQVMKDMKASVFLVFQNKEDNHLGMPLPGGVMRVYQQDKEGTLQFAGEDRIKHTPKDEEVRLHLGEAFDVVCERTQTDFQRISDRVFESAYEIKIRNHKKSDVTVDIVEPMSDDWKILNASHEYKKKDARTAVFSVPAPADGETVLTYRVRVTF